MHRSIFCLKLFKHVACTILLLFSSFNAFADTLKQIINYTIATHPQVLTASNARIADNYGLTIAKAGYLPTVNLTYSVGREHSVNQSDTPPEATLSPQQFGMEFRENLFAGLSTENEVNRNRNTINSAAYNIQGRANDVALLAGQAFLAVKQQRERASIAKENLAIHERIYEMIKERFDSGLSRKADLIQTQARLALARSNYVSILSDLRAAEANFVALIGKTPGQLEDIKIDLTKYPRFPRNELNALRAAIVHQPYIKAATADILARIDQLGASKALFSPRIDAVVRVNRGREVGGSAGPDEDTAGLLEVSWNVLNGGADYGQVKQNQALINEAKSIRDNTVRETVEQTKLSWSTYISAEEQLPYLTEHKKLSRKTVGFYIDQYRVGKRSLLDLLDAENEAFSSAVAYINGYYILLNGELRLLHADNQLLTYTQAKLPITAKPPHPIDVIVGKKISDTYIHFHTQFAKNTNTGFYPTHNTVRQKKNKKDKLVSKTISLLAPKKTSNEKPLHLSQNTNTTIQKNNHISVHYIPVHFE